MKSFFSLLLILGHFYSAPAEGQIFDCRGQSDPMAGFLMLVDQHEAKLQEVINGELSGPVYRGEHRLTPPGYIFVVRIETTQDRVLSFFEIWLQESPNGEAIFPAWYFNYGPSLQESSSEVAIKLLDCWVQSEPSPKIFRSEM